jgi:hypothetical protein
LFTEVVMTAPITDRCAATLGLLVAQARDEGASVVTLKALTEEAAEAGAARALARLGLHDGSAGADILELRQLLSAWRDTRRAARHAVIGWLVRLVLAGLLLGLAVKLRLIDLAPDLHG